MIERYESTNRVEAHAIKAGLGCLPTVALLTVLVDGINQNDLIKIGIGLGGLIGGAKLYRETNGISEDIQASEVIVHGEVKDSI